MSRIVNARTIWSATALTVFMVTEILVVAIAGLWAVVGLLHLGRVSTSIVAAIVLIPTAYAVVMVTLLAFRAETAPENQ